MRKVDEEARINRDFEKRWSNFLANVGEPDRYMEGKIKEACREFHKINVNIKTGEWK